MCQHNHDRFLIIDDVVYVFGASLKDASKKLFANGKPIPILYAACEVKPSFEITHKQKN